MHVLWPILIGSCFGLIGKLLTPGREPGGFVMAAAIGIAGAALAAYAGRLSGWYEPGQPIGLLLAMFGAIALLAIYCIASSKPS